MKDHCAARQRRYAEKKRFAETNLFTKERQTTRMRALGAGVAELVDAADSKSASFTRVGVRVPSPVPFFLRKYASFLASATECQSNLAFFRLNLAGWILGVDAREFGQRIPPSGWMLDTPPRRGYTPSIHPLLSRYNSAQSEKGCIKFVFLL